MSDGTPLRLVVASANPDKVKEIVAVLSDAMAVELVPRPDDVPDVVEDGETLLDNARLKARALAAATGTAACRLDSSLMPASASPSRPSSSLRVNAMPSAVPCTSTNLPAPVMTTFMSTSARESSA